MIRQQDRHRSVRQATKSKASGEAIFVLMQRVSRIVLAIVAFVAALAFFGIDMKTTLAGLVMRRRLLPVLCQIEVELGDHNARSGHCYPPGFGRIQGPGHQKF